VKIARACVSALIVTRHVGFEPRQPPAQAVSFQPFNGFAVGNTAKDAGRRHGAHRVEQLVPSPAGSMTEFRRSGR
jgi:hypothetical protein